MTGPLSRPHLAAAVAHTAIDRDPSFDASLRLQKRFHEIIPGGSHTYAKGDDQYPEFMPPYIVRGKGCRVWDADGNEFIEYGMGLRAVSLGHAYAPVVEAARRQMELGSNFTRPAVIELECAEALLGMVKRGEMVKFGKNGSDATSAAIRLSRAYTGRDRVAICGSQPFFSTDDWFMGTTAIAAGIPRAVRDLTVKFKYNDIQSVRDLFIRYPGEIACLILEAAKETDPVDGFLHATRKLCKQHGVVFILDEMITGFRWHNGGAQAYYDIDPDLSTFGKALGNGFAISALVGKRDIMRLGGINHDRERVFLISTTHGAESHGLAAALEVMRIYREQPVIDTLRRQGERLAAGVAKSIEDLGLDGYFSLLGKPWCMVYGTRDQQKQPSQPFRTLFIQEALKRGLLAPSFIVSYAHTDADIDRTIEATHGALEIYRQALDVGVDKYLVGRPVKPVMRAHC